MTHSTSQLVPMLHGLGEREGSVLPVHDWFVVLRVMNEYPTGLSL
jgi:hypothetical protein